MRLALPGGSYGALGGVAGNETANAVYGDYHSPNNLVRGSCGTATARGIRGRVGADYRWKRNKLMPSTILANGGNNGGGGGGGSGGGVLLNVGNAHWRWQRLRANGAGNGSEGTGGGGSGGRVAIYYGSNTFNYSSNVTAIGGHTTAPERAERRETGLFAADGQSW